MKYPIISLCSLCVLVSSCYSGSEQFVVHSLSPQKQKQKMAFLKKKLAIAENEKKKAEDEVQRLADEIDAIQLALIRRQVDLYDQQEKKVAKLFLDEREALYQMIQTGPSPSAFEAQVELDRILRIITAYSDDS
ncbi:MAG: hypothetical protein COT85_00580 [Chlamydiae bacterium CG10_big_fil_rev_8_21_14_0_10_42_34]|nr:MAG: hypothetical protein COT85_00580 [Chlamydiae bacterium CG10_big_fil_rev_8_21_14_0_10_42_34]